MEHGSDHLHTCEFIIHIIHVKLYIQILEESEKAFFSWKMMAKSILEKRNE